jgi:hypothetical protein
VKISLTLSDDRVPRTIFYQRFLDALLGNSRFTPDAAGADLLFPAEDTAQDQNWPNYGNPAAQYLRGDGLDRPVYEDYLQRLARHQQSDGRPMCIVNMHPLHRLPQAFKDMPGVIVADVNLHAVERAINPRTISIPELALVCGAGRPTQRTILASFRGADSHPVRQALAQLHDNQRFHCHLVDRNLAPTAPRPDPLYVQLLEQSIFAFVPRGDCLCSYRLAEVMSFGCIPIILSDGWVLPFDRLIPWTIVSVIVPEQEVPKIPAILDAIPPARVREMQQAMASLYQRHFADLGAVVESLLTELELGLDLKGR